MVQATKALQLKDAETVYLWNGKVMTYKKFIEKMGEKKVKTVKTVTSPDEINALGFDNTKVKKIMVATN